MMAGFCCWEKMKSSIACVQNKMSLLVVLTFFTQYFKHLLHFYRFVLNEIRLNMLFNIYYFHHYYSVTDRLKKITTCFCFVIKLSVPVKNEQFLKGFCIREICVLGQRSRWYMHLNPVSFQVLRVFLHYG